MVRFSSFFKNLSLIGGVIIGGLLTGTVQAENPFEDMSEREPIPGEHHEAAIISDLQVTHNQVAEPPQNRWEIEMSLQAGFYVNQWGHTGGVKRIGNEWASYDGGGNFNSGLNVDNTGLQLHQFYIGLGRQFSLGNEWHVDVHSDIMYGSNAQFFQCVNNRFDGMALSGGRYGLAIPQLYASLGTENFHVKVGKFLTPFGNDHDGFFYSDSYSPLPDTHMGVMADWETRSGFNLLLGWTQGWNEAFDSDSRSSLVWFGIGRELTEELKLGYTMCAGNMEGFDNTYTHSLLLEWFINEKMTYAIEYQLVDMKGSLGEDADWAVWGLINCFIYHFNDKLDGGVRVEYQYGNSGDSNTSVFETTLCLSWSPFKKDENSCMACRLFKGELVIRPEIRYDSNGGTEPFQFNDGKENNQISGGISLDYTF